MLLFLFTINSCKVNQTRDKVKVGRWVYSDTVNNISYKTTGKYKNGIEKIVDINLNDSEKALFAKSADAVRAMNGDLKSVL